MAPDVPMVTNEYVVEWRRDGDRIAYQSFLHLEHAMPFYFDCQHAMKGWGKRWTGLLTLHHKGTLLLMYEK